MSRASTTPSPRPAGREGAVETTAGQANARAHIVLNAALAMLFIGLFAQSASLPSSMWEPLGAGSFPRLVLGALIVINLAIIVQEAKRYPQLAAPPRGLVRDWLWRHRLAMGVLALFALFSLAVPMLGFPLAALAFLLLVQILLGARRPRSLIIALVIAGVFSFGLDWLFRDVFVISLPRGPLG